MSYHPNRNPYGNNNNGSGVDDTMTDDSDDDDNSTGCRDDGHADHPLQQQPYYPSAAGNEGSVYSPNHQQQAAMRKRALSPAVTTTNNSSNNRSTITRGAPYPQSLTLPPMNSPYHHPHAHCDQRHPATPTTPSSVLKRSNSCDTESLTDSSTSGDFSSTSCDDLEDPQQHQAQSPAALKPFLVSPSSSPHNAAGSVGTDCCVDAGVQGAARISSRLASCCDSVAKQPSTRKQAAKLCFGAAGIYACYLVYGHIQEDVFRYRAADGSKFGQVWFLQVLECVANVLLGLVGRKVFGGRRPASLVPFFQSGASQVFSKVLTSLSLAAGLSFPVCILAKSAKMVPVMLGQLVLGGSKYTSRDCFYAGAVVVGTTMLSMGKSKPGAPSNSSVTGLVFIILSLVADGITGGLQKRLKADTEAQPPTTYDFLLFTNLAMGLVAFTIALAVGDFTSGFLFMAENPLLQQMVVMQCLLSALGQSFIFFVVAHFDPMVCATVTTTRKILSVLWSIAVKGHAVSPQGHVGLVLAILGVLLGLNEKLDRKKKLRNLKKNTPSKQQVTAMAKDPSDLVLPSTNPSVTAK